MIAPKRFTPGTADPRESRCPWFAPVALLLTAALGCGEGRPLEVTYHPELGLRASLYLPRDRHGQLVPGVVLVHGGCFESGSREAMRPHGELLAEHGIAALAIDYRLLSQGGAYPAAVEDVRCALRWLHERGASHGVDPERLALLGASAGGFLAARAGLEPGQAASCGFSSTGPVRAVVVLYAVSDWELRARTGLRECERRFLARACDPSRPLTCRAVSLIAPWVALPTRFLILHGSRDEDIRLEQSERLVRHLRESGIDATLETYPGSGHGFELGTDLAATRAKARLVEFLRGELALSADTEAVDSRGRSRGQRSRPESDARSSRETPGEHP